MTPREQPLDLAQQLRLYKSITKALAEMVSEREAWIAYVEAHGECYCRNPFRAHVDRAEEWARAHLYCASNAFFRRNAPLPTPPISEAKEGS